MNSEFDAPNPETIEGTSNETQSQLWTPSRRIFLGAMSSFAGAGLIGTLGSDALAKSLREEDPFAGLSKSEVRIAKAAAEEAFEEMRAEAIQSLGPQRRTRNDFQRAVQKIGSKKALARARSRLRTQLRRGDKNLGRYRKALAAKTPNLAAVIAADRKKRPAVLTRADFVKYSAPTRTARSSSGFKYLRLKLLKFKLTKTYELGKNEVYVGGLKTDFSGKVSKIGVMKLGDIKKNKTKHFNPDKTVATVPFSSWSGPSSCFCSLVFSEHDPFSQKHEKVIQKAYDEIKKYLKEQSGKLQAALANVFSAVIKAQIIAKILAAIATAAVMWALNKFFKWASSLIGDEVAKPLMCGFKAPTKKPWGSNNKGGVHTKYVSGPGFGGYVTYQWSAT